MISIDDLLIKNTADACKKLYNSDVTANLIQVQKTKKEFTGDYTIVTFPLLKISHKNPEQTAHDIGEYLKNNTNFISEYNVIKGFLNIKFHNHFWIEFIAKYEIATNENNEKTVIEFSSPNTNKPLHLGHIRNNLLGASVSNILRKAGNNVTRVNLVNDRGIHICKSMLAWQLWGKGENPENSGLKGDHLVGKYYVLFDQEYKKQIAQLISEGKTEEDAQKNAPLILSAQEMLRNWENGDKDVVSLWKTMNGWVYDGFEKTYKALGIEFEKTYYESDTYKLGKEIVQAGLNAGVLNKKEDNSVWIDLTADGLDEKLLLRSDGTSVYMTQDIGTAKIRYDEFQPGKMIYVVGNEQNYHFQVLALVMKKLGYDWYNRIHHLSYGMVELPEGKMKSREGTVVDTDDLVEEMILTAKEMSEELGKLEGFTEEQKQEVYRIIALGALKYFILKVDPKKNMVFNPKESIDFNGNTGPFIQYTAVRIKSVLRKADEEKINYSSPSVNYPLSEKERELIKLVYEYSAICSNAANEYSPALIANYLYELAKEFNQFYHDHSIMSAESEEAKIFRLKLASEILSVFIDGLSSLGIEVPEKM